MDVTVKLSLFICFLFHTLYIVTSVSFMPFMFPYPRLKLEARFTEEAGDPLILTPYLKRGEIEVAQNLSRVPLTDVMGFPSYAGFFTVNKTYDSNLYFWYFPQFCANTEAPVVLWLQGGPGGASLYGLLTEIGPLIPKKTGFARRKYHWALNHHLIFIDNPVGTGFSFTKNDNGYCEDETCVAKGLYSAMQQFFTLFPHLRSNDFYITGESYAGKYIPALGIEILNMNSAGGEDPIYLKGMAIGNGYCDPINQLDYGNYLYQHGLIDNNQLDVFLTMQKKIAVAIGKSDYPTANALMDKLIDGEMTNFSYFKTYTGFNYYYNYLYSDDHADMSIFAHLLQNDEIRHNIHVGGLPFNDGETVQIHLLNDILKTVAPYITRLLSHYPILFYNGQLDIIVAYPLTENFLQKLPFDSANQYKTANRRIWYVDKEVAGYVKKAGNLTEILVRNAGHMVPHDQPKWALDMITKFIRRKL